MNKLVKNIKENWYVYICFGLVMTVYICRLMDDSIRFDEAIEYFIAKNPFHDIFALNLQQFQPPLYNWVLHILLIISDSTLFYRFTNIFFVFIGLIALYKIVKITSENKITSTASLFLMLCFCASLYYNQISAEYSMVLGILYWLFYYTLRLMKDDCTIKEYIVWMLVCVIAMYTQYGAVFAIVAAGIILLIYYIRLHKISELKKLVGTSGIGIILFGIPLYFGVARYQMKQQGSSGSIHLAGLSKRYLLKGPFDAFQFILYAWSEYKIYWIIIACIIFVGALFVAKKQQILFSNLERQMIYICICNWILYYLGVITQKYAYGSFESRHTLLIMPVTVATIAVVGSRILIVLYNNSEQVICKLGIAGIIGIFVFYIVHGCYYNIAQHWNYCQMDVAVDISKDYMRDENISVWMNFMSIPEAVYYLPMDTEEKVRLFTDVYTCNETYVYKNITFSKTNDINLDYEEKLPDKLLVIWSDVSGDEQMRESLSENGYRESVLYEGVQSAMADGTRVFLFVRE